MSRVVTSQGWRPHSIQIGQTGMRIAPDLYIACGISGAIQHIVGARAAKRILAINTDADAPIMAVADYAVIGDLHQSCRRSAPRCGGSSAAESERPAEGGSAGRVPIPAGRGCQLQKSSCALTAAGPQSLASSRVIKAAWESRSASARAAISRSCFW